MNTYQALHARYYDVVFAAKPYAEEAAFVAGRLPRPPARLLDLACGTGRHAAAFAALGFDVTGVDISPDLLAHFERNAPGARAVQADMREVDLGERFDAVTCLFDSIGYPLTDEGVLAALTAARRHLADGGVLAVEFLHTPALLRAHEPVKVRRWPLPAGGTLLRVAETTLDAAGSSMRVAYELVALGPDGTYERAAEEQANRFFTVGEMRALMGQAGLRVREAVAAYATEPTVTAETFHVLVVAS